MGDVIGFLTNLTPLGLAGLLALILYLQVRNGKATALISDNHLSGLPDMQASLDRIAASLDRLEERQIRACDQLTYITAKMNGGAK